MSKTTVLSGVGSALQAATEERAPRAHLRVGDSKHDSAIVLARVWRHLFDKAIDAYHRHREEMSSAPKESNAKAGEARAYLDACEQVENALNIITRKDSAEPLRTTREHVVSHWVF